MAMVQLMLYREEKMVLYQGELKRPEYKATGFDGDDYWDKNYPGKKNSYKDDYSDNAVKSFFTNEIKALF